LCIFDSNLLICLRVCMERSKHCAITIGTDKIKTIEKQAMKGRILNVLKVERYGIKIILFLDQR
jgi:hypothetical protein